MIRALALLAVAASGCFGSTKGAPVADGGAPGADAAASSAVSVPVTDAS